MFDISTFTVDHAGYSSVPSALSLYLTENSLCLSYNKKTFLQLHLVLHREQFFSYEN